MSWKSNLVAIIETVQAKFKQIPDATDSRHYSFDIYLTLVNIVKKMMIQYSHLRFNKVTSKFYCYFKSFPTL